MPRKKDRQIRFPSAEFRKVHLLEQRMPKKKYPMPWLPPLRPALRKRPPPVTTYKDIRLEDIPDPPQPPQYYDVLSSSVDTTLTTVPSLSNSRRMRDDESDSSDGEMVIREPWDIPPSPRRIAAVRTVKNLAAPERKPLSRDNPWLSNWKVLPAIKGTTDITFQGGPQRNLTENEQTKYENVRLIPERKQEDILRAEEAAERRVRVREWMKNNERLKNLARRRMNRKIRPEDRQDDIEYINKMRYKRRNEVLDNMKKEAQEEENLLIRNRLRREFRKPLKKKTSIKVKKHIRASKAKNKLKMKGKKKPLKGILKKARRDRFKNRPWRHPTPKKSPKKKPKFGKVQHQRPEWQYAFWNAKQMPPKVDKIPWKKIMFEPRSRLTSPDNLCNYQLLYRPRMTPTMKKMKLQPRSRLNSPESIYSR